MTGVSNSLAASSVAESCEETQSTEAGLSEAAQSSQYAKPLPVAKSPHVIYPPQEAQSAQPDQLSQTTQRLLAAKPQPQPQHQSKSQAIQHRMTYPPQAQDVQHPHMGHPPQAAQYTHPHMVQSPHHIVQVQMTQAQYMAYSHLMASASQFHAPQAPYNYMPQNAHPYMVQAPYIAHPPQIAHHAPQAVQTPQEVHGPQIAHAPRPAHTSQAVFVPQPVQTTPQNPLFTPQGTPAAIPQQSPLFTPLATPRFSPTLAPTPGPQSGASTPGPQPAASTPDPEIAASSPDPEYIASSTVLEPATQTTTMWDMAPPAKKRRGPKPKPLAERKLLRTTPILRKENTYSKRKREEVIMWMINTRVDRRGEMVPPSTTDAENHFQIPRSTIAGWKKSMLGLGPIPKYKLK
ncbi:hypothetical protein FHETE_6706 [Fusarium heterosporum]|uniref:Uncharacterized protein n=1 Tax=Fusarium heterosporum TaxID=42747 RepID=A0A8H5T965_FUSHE|nr:hypothetical protein FHETE_6706 [Fusarium heterosporum]